MLSDPCLTGHSSMTRELLDYRHGNTALFLLSHKTHTHTDTQRHFPGYLLTCLGGPGGAQSGAVEWFC